MKRMMPTLALALTTGCTGDIAGVWLMSLDAVDTAECGTTLTHTYRGAQEVQEENSFDPNETDWEMTDSLSFIQIIEKRGGDAVMLLGEEAYPGRKLDGGAWRFAWDASTEERTVFTDMFDYSFETWDRQENDVTIRLSQSGWGTGRGKVSSVVSSVQGWLESDNWSVEESETFSRTPSDDYLEDSEGWRIRNDADEDDCDGNCELEVRDSCATTSTFTAERLTHTDDDEYQYLSGAGQDQGAGS